MHQEEPKNNNNSLGEESPNGEGRDNPGFKLAEDQTGATVRKTSSIECADFEKEVVQSASSDIQYKIDDVPPWYLCIILGLQHYLTMFGATVSIPFVLASSLCITDNNLAKSQLLSTIFFVSGICTFLQTTFGSRLPIVQGGTFSFILPTIALLKQPPWGDCPTSHFVPDLSVNLTSTTIPPDTNVTEHWKLRILEVQGAIAVASVVQIVLGFTGVIGIMLQFIGPLAIAPCIILVGLSLFDAAAFYSSKQWWIAILMMVLICVFSQYIKEVALPTYRRGSGCIKQGSFKIFKLFPILISIGVAWGICAILTATGVLEENSWSQEARTDRKTSVITEAPWFRIPYPGQWGMPTVSAAGVFGIVSGVFASMVESVGDYYAAARLSGAPPPPVHAINRGIGIEGIGCLIAGLVGSGNGTTSYSENIGALGITKVGSRRVIQVGAAIMIVFGVLGKFGAVFVTIPDPVIGGMFMVMFGMITAVGISNLQFVDMNSSRNLFIIGFSLFFGLSFSKWMTANSGVIDTGNKEVDQILSVLLSTGMFVGGVLGFFLDNTIPGTDKERGITAWRDLPDSETDDTKRASPSCYSLPWGMDNWFRRFSGCRYVPFSPTFEGIKTSRCCKRGTRSESTSSAYNKDMESQF